MSEKIFHTFFGVGKLLQLVAEWKVLDINTVVSLTHYKYKNAARLMKSLSDDGYVEVERASHNKKYFFLSKKGAKLLGLSAHFGESRANLNHDICVMNFMHKCIKSEDYCSFFEIFDNPGDSELVPDAFIDCISFELAVEVELTQKSSKRIKGKFSTYRASKKYDYVLYVTNKETTFSAYQRFLSEMSSEVQKKVVLLYCEKVHSGKFELEDLMYFFKGETGAFGELKLARNQ